MKFNRVFLQAAKIVGVLVIITLYFWYVKILYSQTEEKATQIIKKIEIAGNRRISTNIIRSSMRIKEGDPYDPKVVNQDVDAIWSLGFFENIEVELEKTDGGLKVIFHVTERTVIDKIQFHGNKSIKTKKLLREIEIKKGEYLKYYLLKMEEDRIRGLYIKKCFPWVQIKTEVKETNGYAEVHFYIEEGPRTRIESIEFRGNTAFTRRKLLKQMETREAHFPKFIFPGRFEQKKFEADIEKLKEFYMNKGWLDVEIGWEVTYSDDYTDMYIVIHVQENGRYYVERVDIAGATIFTEEEIKEKLKLKEDRPFLLDALEKDTYQIRLMYGEQGYIGASVNEKHTFTAEGRKVNIQFTINEGGRYYIEKIKITGNDKTKDNVIRRQLTFYPGERLDIKKIQESQRRLVNTGYFDMESGVPAGINFEQGSEPNKQNILIDVKEGRTGMLRFGGGFGANVGAFADISYTDRNFDVTDLPKSWEDFLQGNAFRGAGEILTLRFSPGFQRTEILASLTNPSVFDSPYSAGVSMFNFLRFFQEYQQKNLGSRVSVGREIKRDFFLRLTPEFNVIDIDRRDDEDETPQDVLDVLGSQLKAGITLSAIVNKTDNIFAPTSGYEGDASIEFAGLDVDIIKIKLKSTFYKTLFEVPGWGKHVLAYGGTFGAIEPTSEEKTPIFERFFAGGFGSIRGFEYRGISPVDTRTGDQIGGDLLLVANVEYLVPVYQDIVRAAFFIDAGKADKTISDISFDRFRLAAGIGIRFSVPFLGRSTIALDYGFPLLKEEGDETQAISFNFGGGGSSF